MHLRIIIAIARRDLVDALKNMYLLFAIILPIAMSLLFRVLFGGASGSSSGVGVIDVSIYDAGKSQLAQYLMDSKQFSMYFVGSSEEVRADMEKNGRVAGLAIPANFDADLAAKKTPDLTLYSNSKRGEARGAIFESILDAGLRSVAKQTLPANIMRSEISPGSTTTSTTTFDLNRFYLNLFLVMSLTMVGVFVVPYILVEEKEKGTLKAVLVSPATYADVVIGKALVGIFYALVAAFALMLFNNGFSGNIVVTVLAVVLGSVFLVQIGLLMGAAFKQMTQVNSWSSIVMITLMLPGMFGDFLPPPQPIQTVMKLIPTSYMAVAINQGMSNTVTMASAVTNLGILSVAAVIAFVAVIWFMKRERL
jgi:ABC-2 type transport system permease protein